MAGFPATVERLPGSRSETGPSTPEWSAIDAGLERSATEQDGATATLVANVTAPVISTELASTALPHASAAVGDKRPTAVGQYLLLSAFAVVVAATFMYAQSKRPAASAAPEAARGVEESGTATFDSNPSGTEVAIDGVVRGKTPLTLTLPAGAHEVAFANGGVLRKLSLDVNSKTVAAQYVDFGSASEAAATVSTGRLEISSEPAGAQVRIDGVPSGITPLRIAAIPAGEHRILLSLGGTVVTRTVRVTPNSTANVVVSTLAPGGAAGWVSINAPFEMQIFEDGRLLGTTSVDRVMLPVGSHVLELVNQPFDFRTRLSVQVAAAQTAAAQVTVPNGLLSINALPWADVLIDGRSVGTTPLGNIAVPIGSREVLWRHPQLGERRRTVAVTASGTTRIGMDFSE